VASKIVPVKVCDRCAFGKEKPVTTTRKFSIDDDHYIIDLCEPHAVMFDRDIGQWARLGRDDEKFAPARTMFTDESIERERRAAEVRAKSQPGLFAVDGGDATIATAMRVVRNSAHADHLRWSLTAHARERADERDVTIAEVIECAAHPEHTMQSDRGDGTMIHHKRDVRICVEPKAKIVVTVYPRVDSALDRVSDRYVGQAAKAR
jgi:hypothetical protein